MAAPSPANPIALGFDGLPHFAKQTFDKKESTVAELYKQCKGYTMRIRISTVKSWSMPLTYYHPYLNNPTARDEPDARRCALCGFKTAAKNKNGFVTVERVREDACHGRYLVVFGRASVLMGF
ncbi:hypothetical protein QJQ45_020429, partial [Haematococcus lacustris]